MKFVSLFLFILPLHLAGASCPKKVNSLVNDYTEREKYGIQHDGKRWSPPKDCTPMMVEKKMIPLSKRRSAGVNRERYMDKDCNVYEWDYQHGRFEKYKLSGSSNLVHQGEVLPVTGEEITSKMDSKRDYSDTSTGLDGYNLKSLCREHNRGILNSRVFEKSSEKASKVCM